MSITKRFNEVRHIYDVLAKEYDASYRAPLFLAENQVIFSWLQRYLCGYQLPVLELACGTGLLLEGVDLAPEDYIGLDLSPEMLKEARRKFPGYTFVEGDMQDLSRFPDSSVGAVVSIFGGLSYVKDQFTVLSECERVLAPGGKLFLMNYGPSYEQRPSYILNRQRFGHLPLFLQTAHRMAALARAALLEEVSVQGFHAFPERLFPSIPASWLVPYFHLEMQAIGRIWPATCYFQILMGKSQPSPKGIRDA